MAAGRVRWGRHGRSVKLLVPLCHSVPILGHFPLSGKGGSSLCSHTQGPHDFPSEKRNVCSLSLSCDLLPQGPVCSSKEKRCLQTGDRPVVYIFQGHWEKERRAIFLLKHIFSSWQPVMRHYNCGAEGKSPPFTKVCER